MKTKQRVNHYFLVFITVLFLLIFANELSNSDIFISHPLTNLEKLWHGLISFRLSNSLLSAIFSSYYNTLLFATTGLCLAIYIAIGLSYFSSRFISFRWGKYLAIFFRSGHEVVLMYLLMIVFGLNIYIAVLAIAISFGGIISKVFTDNMDTVSDQHYLSYKNRGYSYTNNFFFHLFPSTFNNNLSYIFYRYECSIRSCIVLSYIGIPGIGFYITMSLSDLDYNALFIYLYSLVIFVFMFNFLMGLLIHKLKFNIATCLKWFIPFSIVMMAIFLTLHYESFIKLFQYQNWMSFIDALKDFFSLFNVRGDFYRAENMALYWKYTVQTVILGVVATLFLVFLFVLLMMQYLRSYVSGGIINKRINDLFSVVSRAIPEVVFLTLLLFIMKPNIISGALALSLHNAGILFKLMTDRVENSYAAIFTVYKNRNYKATSLFLFVLIPTMWKDFLNLLSYRFEMIIKGSIIVGILGSGGLGYLFKLKMSKFDYQGVYFITLIYFGLFIALDIINKRIVKCS